MIAADDGIAASLAAARGPGDKGGDLPAPPFPLLTGGNHGGSVAGSSSDLHLFPSIRRKLAALPANKRQSREDALERVLNDRAVHKLILRSDYSRLVDDLYRRLLLGAAGVLLGERFEGGLNISIMADFLGLLITAPKEDLPWVIRVGLRWLGLGRQKGKPGRPAGRITDMKYVAWVQGVLDLTEEERVWELRTDFKKKYPRDWHRRLDHILQKRLFSSSFIELLLKSKTPQSFAISLTANHFHVLYDVIARAHRRTKAAKK